METNARLLILVCAVKDRLMATYAQPMFFPSEGVAIRSFQDAINDPNNNISKHSDDYDLYLIGYWDEATGTFTNYPMGPKQLGIGKQLKITKA